MAGRLAASVLAALAVGLPHGASAMQRASGKPMNFTAVKNGDWFRNEVYKVKLAQQKRKDVAIKVRAERRAIAEDKRRAAMESTKKKIAETAKHTHDVMNNWTHKQANRTQRVVEKFGNTLEKAVMRPIEAAKDVDYSRLVEKNHLLNGDMFTTQSTTMAPLPCTAPEPNEKVAYFVHAAQAENVLDGVLTPRGEEQARRLATHQNLSVALQQGQGHVQLLVSGASRRAMKTALLGFKEALANATWEVNPDIELRHTGEPSPALGVAMLNGMGEKTMLASYKRQIAVDNGGHEHLWQNYADRWHHFIDQLRNRTEDRIIVVTDKWNLAMTGLEVIPGSVGIAALRLQPDADDVYGDKQGAHAWRHLSDPGCW